MVHTLCFLAIRLRSSLWIVVCIVLFVSCSLSGSDGGSSGIGSEGTSSDTGSSTGSTPSGSLSGSLDTTFGFEGKVITAIGTGDDYINDLALQSDGKIVAVGVTQNSSTYAFALARYNPDGSLDSSFGTGGKVTTPIGTIADMASGIVIQSDKKIVVAGTTTISNGSAFALVRYNEDGSLDTSFGIGGIVTTQIGNTAGANGIAVQSDGKIILAGYAFMDSALTFTLARYNPNGSLDSTFGTGGKVTNKIGNYSIANGVKVQTDGKIIVVGSQKINNYTDFSIVRYKENGVLDTTFGNGGIVLTSLCPSNDSASCVANLSDGNILVGGYLKNGSSYDFALIRYKQDGSIDMSFGQEGKVITSIQTGDDRANKILIQSDGKIILVGYSSGTDFALARYNPDGSLDSSFGTGGKVTTKILYGNGSANAGILQPDGSIVVGGYVVSGSQKDFALARYKP